MADYRSKITLLTILAIALPLSCVLGCIVFNCLFRRRTIDKLLQVFLDRLRNLLSTKIKSMSKKWTLISKDLFILKLIKVAPFVLITNAMHLLIVTIIIILNASEIGQSKGPAVQFVYQNSTIQSRFIAKNVTQGLCSKFSKDKPSANNKFNYWKSCNS